MQIDPIGLRTSGRASKVNLLKPVMKKQNDGLATETDDLGDL